MPASSQDEHQERLSATITDLKALLDDTQAIARKIYEIQMRHSPEINLGSILPALDALHLLNKEIMLYIEKMEWEKRGGKTDEE